VIAGTGDRDREIAEAGVEIEAADVDVARQRVPEQGRGEHAVDVEGVLEQRNDRGVCGIRGQPDRGREHR
jgi:hypothetical protein